MTCKSVVVTRLGSPEVLQVVENELRAPAAGQTRIQVLAASVSRPDVTVRTGEWCSYDGLLFLPARYYHPVVDVCVERLAR